MPLSVFHKGKKTGDELEGTFAERKKLSPIAQKEAPEAPKFGRQQTRRKSTMNMNHSMSLQRSKSVYSISDPDQEFFTYAEIMNKDKTPPRECTDDIFKNFDEITFSAISF
jgi:hypothetical protein